MDILRSASEELGENSRPQIEKALQSFFTALGCFPFGSEASLQGDQFHMFRTGLKSPVSPSNEFFDGSNDPHLERNYRKFWEEMYGKKIDSASIRHLPNAHVFLPYLDDNSKTDVVKVAEGYLDLRHKNGAFEQLSGAGSDVYIMGPLDGELPKGLSGEQKLAYLSERAMGIVNGNRIYLPSGKKHVSKICYGLTDSSSTEHGFKVDNDSDNQLVKPANYQDMIVTMFNNLAKKIGPHIIDRIIRKLREQDDLRVHHLTTDGLDNFFSKSHPDLIRDIQRQIASSKSEITHNTLPELWVIVRNTIRNIAFLGAEDPIKAGEYKLEIMDDQHAVQLMASAVKSLGIGAHALDCLLERWNSHKQQFNPESTKEFLFRSFPTGVKS